jgi:hypothetical protein
MQLAPKSQPLWIHFTEALSLALKLSIIGIAWLIFFYLVILGWDLHHQNDPPPKSSPFEQLY